MVASWIVFPLVLGVLALGCGLLLERATGRSLPGPLLAPVGLAVIIVAADFATSTDATAELATPAVIVLAAAGFVTSKRSWRIRLDGWALACALAVLAVFAAPIVLSGEATIAGYIKIEDTVIWLTLTDHVMEHGRSLAGLAPSSYEAILDEILDQGYPVGAFLPFGVAGRLVGQDLAWLLQPYSAFLATMVALCLYQLISGLVRSRAVRALVVFVASQPALLFAYSLWGGIKELIAVWALALLAALLPAALERDVSLRDLLPLALAGAALLASLSVGGLVWLAALLVPALVFLDRLVGGRLALRRALGFAALAAAFSLPTLIAAPSFIDLGSNTLTKQSVLGNLIEPLSPFQIFGIWPTGDFRLGPDDGFTTGVLIAITAAAGVVGLVWAWRRRAAPTLLFVFAALLGLVMVAVPGAPWLDAKALVTASPAVLLAALLGAAAILESGNAVVGALVAVAITGGVLWSNGLAYHDVDLAPRERLAELEEIGGRIDGEGPTLTTEYEFYGVRHFLREADPEGTSLLSREMVPLRNGQPLTEGDFADIDDFQLASLVHYPTLVLRRSPLGSRPPSLYKLTWRGRYYEVWQRDREVAAAILDHLALGDPGRPTSKPSCRQILALARTSGTARLAAVVRAPAIVVEPSQSTFDRDHWRIGKTFNPERPRLIGEDPSTLSPLEAAMLEARVRVGGDARFGVWLGGSFRGGVELSIDGRPVGEDRQQLNYSPGQYLEMGEVPLRAGPHTLTLHYDGADLRPGSAGNGVAPFGERVDQPFALGPLVLSQSTADRPVSYVSAGEARSLCNKSLDWVELLGA